MLCIAYTRSVGFQKTTKPGTINKACYNYIHMLSSHDDISVKKVKKNGATTRRLILFNIVFDIKKKISVQNRFVLPMTFKIFNNGKKTELLFIYNR